MCIRDRLIGTYLDVEDLWDINYNLRLFRVFKNRLEDLGKYRDLKDKFYDVPTVSYTHLDVYKRQSKCKRGLFNRRDSRSIE